MHTKWKMHDKTHNKADILFHHSLIVIFLIFLFVWCSFPLEIRVEIHCWQTDGYQPIEYLLSLNYRTRKRQDFESPARSLSAPVGLRGNTQNNERPLSARFCPLPDLGGPFYPAYSHKLYITLVHQCFVSTSGSRRCKRRAV